MGAEAAGLFESRDGGGTFSLLTTLDDRPGRDKWNNPANQPPGHLGLSAILPHPADPDALWVIVQGYSIFETTDGGETWAPRNKGLRADWPLENPEVGYCVHKLVLSPPTTSACTSRTTSACTAATTRGSPGRRSPRGCRREFGFAAAVHPHDRDSFYVIPLDAGHTRSMPDGEAAVWRTRDAGSSWQRLDRGLPQHGAYVGVLREGMAIDTLDTPGLYFGTSTGQVFASADEGDSWSEIASYLPGITSVEVARSTDGRRLSPLDAAAALPRPARRAGGRGDDGAGGDRPPRRTLAGPSRPALRARPGIRRHINVYVDRERAALDTLIGESSRVDVIAAISGG